MKKTLETKLMIIENFIDHFTTNEEERERMKNSALQYVEEDHVDEIEQAGFTSEVKLKTVNVSRTIKANSVEQGLTVRMTEEQKDRLVDENLIHFDGVEWKFFDSDLEKVRELVELHS